MVLGSRIRARKIPRIRRNLSGTRHGLLSAWYERMRPLPVVLYSEATTRAVASASGNSSDLRVGGRRRGLCAMMFAFEMNIGPTMRARHLKRGFSDYSDAFTCVDKEALHPAAGTAACTSLRAWLYHHHDTPGQSQVTKRLCLHARRHYSDLRGACLAAPFDANAAERSASRTYVADGHMPFK
jgi:hypothetical protein